MISNTEIRELGQDLRYGVGPVLYCPADNPSVAENLVSGKLGHINTIILCLEDAILPQNVRNAETILLDTMRKLDTVEDKSQLPLIFIRVRDPQHLKSIYDTFGWYDALTGFVLPKFDTENMAQYRAVAEEILAGSPRFYFMPILETEPIMGSYRDVELKNIKEFLNGSTRILSILIGGNDLCKSCRVRRAVDETIYDINIVRDVLTDIVRTFGDRYTISAPIWEYFDCDGWEEGLRREMKLDKLNGFIGKSCIHPKQVAVVQDCMKVSASDYADACQILNWDSNKGVQRSNVSGRMNEPATHTKWAERTVLLAKIYGVRS